ncbi:hypothetical protein QKT49_gp227 [Acanthamoeba castellanii medusavirus]|uniref:Uncharacterized protein n=1 Tax=Acanthamoeba castellanii medusavirus J1 TaxID=3114988 RepID=A0A3T1CXH9_9VIRU|nr:hypothetical protein QKT49_gp227 [Acanthamoeba castellanii medusavirus]BBI30536.1 hypothetical protein [Acanthamoeba castellanii medusavirus J1]
MAYTFGSEEEILRCLQSHESTSKFSKSTSETFSRAFANTRNSARMASQRLAIAGYDASDPDDRDERGATPKDLSMLAAYAEALMACAKKKE